MEISRLVGTLSFFMAFVLFGPTHTVGEEPAAFDMLATDYERDVRPLLERFCLDCHSSESPEGDLDLQRFASLAEVRRETKVWLKVDEMLALGEMPPTDSEQPSPDQLSQLRDWISSYLHVEALAGAGDPGPVVLRHLTNAEYTYTVRDLTGVDLNPARQFPSEGAAGEGFTNTGNALVMSPGLLRKYLEAGKEIAAHAVLLPDGFRFSTHTTQRDWTDELLANIRAFYAEFSEIEQLGLHYNHDLAHLGKSGRIPLAKYFAATLAHRDSLQVGNITIEAVAARYDLNAKYLGILWSTLHDDTPSLLLDELRSEWHRSKPEDAAALAAHVAARQKGLWAFNPIGVLGRKGSRSRWLEAIDPLLIRQEMRFEIPAPKEGQESQDFVVSLVTTDAGDGNEHDLVKWTQPRLVAEGQPDILLPGWLSADGKAIDAASVCVRAPSVMTLRIPAELAGRDLVTTATLEPDLGTEGSVQVDVIAGTPNLQPGLQPSEVIVTYSKVDIGADKRTVSYRRAVLVGEKSQARKRLALAMDDYRSVFPAALCYAQIVPVDETLTLTLLYREDDHLVRLMLDDKQVARLDKLWSELRYVSREPLRLVDVLDSLLETIDNDHPQMGIFDDLIQPINERADVFRTMLVDSESSHLDALIALSQRAGRRPTTGLEEQELRGLYHQLRELDLPHEEAFRLTLARVFVSPQFLYRLEETPTGSAAAPISDGELANRLSYFLWSSMPDDKLRAVAVSGRLTRRHDRESDQEDGVAYDELLQQTRRMLADSRVRRLATEFACQWLHIHQFDPLETKSEKHFPEFAELRGDMYEESILFLTDLFQQDGSLLNLLNADHTFVNERLAKFYGVSFNLEPQVTTDSPEDTLLSAGDRLHQTWRRVDGIQRHGRGGILGLATTLAKQSGATRTSPILRGNWVSEVLLGEKLPRPPKNVPQLADAIPEGLTERQLIEQHSRDTACAKCHSRIDPIGFALESFDAIGRQRQADAGGKTIDTRTTLPDGTEIEGLSGLREYLLAKRRDQFLRQFCRKLLGYAIGRELGLSDEPLLDEMMSKLAKNDFHFSVAVETIVLSDQFRKIRGREMMSK